MSGETSDISQFCKLEWFECIVYWDETVPFPDDEVKLGCYLGPSIDIGPAMTAKILTQNGQVLHRSPYRLLTPDELLDKDGSDAWERFMAWVYERLGSWVPTRELEDIGLEYTLQYDPYEDVTQNKHVFPLLAEVQEPMPEGGDHYIGNEMLLHKGDKMARGHVVAVELLEHQLNVLSKFVAWVNLFQVYSNFFIRYSEFFQ